MTPQEFLVKFSGQPWAILPGFCIQSIYETMAELARSGAAPGFVAPEEPPYELLDDGTAIIHLNGVLVPGTGKSWLARIFGFVDTRLLTEAVYQAQSDPAVQSLLLVVNSPGGAVTDTQELADAVFELGQTKPTTAWGVGQMCSAAFWVASQCNTVLASPSCAVGAMGVLTQVTDSSAKFLAQGYKVITVASGIYKGIGADGAEVTAEQIGWLKMRTEQIAAEFKKYVLARRPNVPKECFQGQSFSASDSVHFGMADGLSSRMEDALKRARVPQRAAGVHSAANFQELVLAYEIKGGSRGAAIERAVNIGPDLYQRWIRAGCPALIDRKRKLT